MNKILRISMIAVLALIANFSFAGVSTIDFTKLSVKTVSDVDNKENNGYTFQKDVEDLKTPAEESDDAISLLFNNRAEYSKGFTIIDKSTQQLLDEYLTDKDKAFVDKYMGQFPVIFISLKDIKGINYDIAKGGLINLVKELARTFSFLQKSEVLSEDDKLDLKNLCSDAYLKDPFNQNNLTSALSFLSSCLYKHFKRQVILLIDEYDVPLAKAAAGKYHKEMVELISSFLGVLKSTPKNTNEDTAPILKVVMTGCLKVAKNSIFTGVNNVVVNTVLNTQTKFTSIIGFNKEETKKVLEDYNLSDYEGMVKENYDGYRFYNEEMFCPWDVINFVAENYEHKLNGTESDIKPGNYWNATSSSKILQEYLGYLNKSIRESLQDLVDGKSIEVKINDSMNYDDLKLHDPDDFFSLLLHTGYLTAVDKIKSNTDCKFVFATIEFLSK